MTARPDHLREAAKNLREGNFDAISLEMRDAYPIIKGGIRQMENAIWIQNEIAELLESKATEKERE